MDSAPDALRPVQALSECKVKLTDDEQRCVWVQVRFVRVTADEMYNLCMKLEANCSESALRRMDSLVPSHDIVRFALFLAIFFWEHCIGNMALDLDGQHAVKWDASVSELINRLFV
jgi:hypothetical protein